MSVSRAIEPLRFLDSGSPDGHPGTPPLLFIHGSFANGRSAWSAQIEALSPYYRLLVPDRRGHGASPAEPQLYTFSGEAADVRHIVDLVGARRFHLIGHSSGGLVALELARQAPHRIASLHLIEPAYLALLPTDPLVAPLIRRGGDIFRHAHVWGPERTAEAFFAMVAGPHGLAKLRESRSWPLLVQEAAATAAEPFPGRYPARALHTLRLPAHVPVHVYVGGRSHAGLRRVAISLASAVPGARLFAIPSAFHDVQRIGEPFNRLLMAAVNAAPSV